LRNVLAAARLRIIRKGPTEAYFQYQDR